MKKLTLWVLTLLLGTLAAYAVVALDPTGKLKPERHTAADVPSQEAIANAAPERAEEEIQIPVHDGTDVGVVRVYFENLTRQDGEFHVGDKLVPHAIVANYGTTTITLKDGQGFLWGFNGQAEYNTGMLWRDGANGEITIQSGQWVDITPNGGGNLEIGGWNSDNTYTVKAGTVSLFGRMDNPDRHGDSDGYGGNNTASASYTFPITGSGGNENPENPENPDVSGDLPVLYINNVDGAITDYNLNDKNYRSGTYWLDAKGQGDNIASADAQLPLEIKARGNYTRQCFSKKPFKLKLGAKQSMLGLTKSKHFALLAHADDTFGFMSNFTAFWLGKRIGLPWTPQETPVELVINGDYRGIYFLTESIRVDENRVNITELDDNVEDYTLSTGGYIVELDNYYGESKDTQIRFPNTYSEGKRDEVGLWITLDTPEIYSGSQKGFVGTQFAKMTQAISQHSDEIWKYMDLDDAARYYIVMEIVSHYEAYHGSTYLHRDRGQEQKWHFGPLWDVGHAFQGGDTNYFYDCGSSMGNTWIVAMRKNDTFNNKVNETWRWFMSQNLINDLNSALDNYVNRISNAVKRDRERWKDVSDPGTRWDNDIPGNGADNTDMDGKLSSVKSHLSNKINWLKNQWGDYANVNNEPARDNTDYFRPRGFDMSPKQEHNLPLQGSNGEVYIYFYDDDDWGNTHYGFINNYSPENWYSGTSWNGPLVDDNVNNDLYFGNLRGFRVLTVPEGAKNWDVFLHADDTYKRFPHDNMMGAPLNGKSHIYIASSGCWMELQEPYKAQNSGTLPLLEISTQDATEVTNSGKVKMNFKLTGTDGTTIAASNSDMADAIKGRGTSTWTQYDKKPYTLSLDKKATLIDGVASSKHYALLPWTADTENALLSNVLGHELSRMIGLAWTPSETPVEVVLNGRYLGLYFLVENIRPSENRVNIPDVGDAGYDPAEDWIFEFDNEAAEGTYYSLGDSEWKVVPSSPESDDNWSWSGAMDDLNKKMPDVAANWSAGAYFDAFKTKVESLLSNLNQGANYDLSYDWGFVVDPMELAHFLIVNELMEVPNAYTHSMYAFHKSGGLWMFGPVWDFGQSFYQSGNSSRLMAADYSTFDGIFKNQFFRAVLSFEFCEFTTGKRYGYWSPWSDWTGPTTPLNAPQRATASGANWLSNVRSYVTNYADKIVAAAAADAAVWPQYQVTDVKIKANALVDKLETRANWLASPQGADWNAQSASDILTGLEKVAIEDTNLPVEYFDLAGRRVAEPRKGVYIRRQGAKAEKIIL